MNFNHTVVTEPENVPGILSELDKGDKFALDFETTGLDQKRSDIHGIALANESSSWYLSHGAEMAALALMGDLLKSKQVIMHNASFDMHFLHRHGLHVPNVIDTMIGQYLLDTEQNIGLKDIAPAVLGINEELPDFKDLQRLGKKLTGKRKLEDVSVYDMPYDLLAEYAARDAWLTYKLWPATEKLLQNAGMIDIFWKMEMPFVHVICGMEEAGFKLDMAFVNKLEEELIVEREKALATWNALTSEVNPASPLQLQKYLYDVRGFPVTLHTDTGAPSTDIMALNRLKELDTTGAVPALIAFRTADKLIGTYTSAFREKVYTDGRLYGSFNRTGTATHRLSSSGPNLQNLPARGEDGSQIRKAFTVEEGNVFICIDQSQLELRIGTHYTREPAMLEVYRTGGDAHQTTADLIGSNRRVGKTVNFLIFYGGKGEKLCDTMEKNGEPRPKRSDADEWLNNYYATHPYTMRWMDKVREYARELGYVRTITGHRRYLPNLKSRDNYLRSQDERRAVNTIIQGSAAGLMEWSMLEIAPLLPQYGARMLAQVHDELCFECPKETAQEFGRLAGEIMVKSGKVHNMIVDLVAEPGFGNNWAEAKH